MIAKLHLLKPAVLIFSLSCLASVAGEKEEDDGWYTGESLIHTRKGALQRAGRRGWWFRQHPEKVDSVQIRTDGEYLLDKKTDIDQMPRLAFLACLKITKTRLSEIITSPKINRCCVIYPELINVSCVSKEREQEFLAEYIEKQKVLNMVLRESREERVKENTKLKKEQEEREKKRAAESLAAKKTECTSFGFKPETPEHAECVMKMAIAEKARDKAESQANAIAEQSAAEAAAYQAELRRVQAQQAAANREAREAAKRQREAQLLIDLGASISSGQFPGGSSSGPTFSDEPMPSSGRYKECFYRVAGDRLSISIPRAEGCPATRNFGSVTGYLTR